MESRFSRRFESNPTDEFYSQVEDYLVGEIARSPELSREMRLFQHYILLMQRLLPPQEPSYVQDDFAYLLTRAAEGSVLPASPITLPPPGRALAVGEHMMITNTFAEEIWPDRKRRKLELSDGIIVTPQSSIGRIDIVRNLPRLDTGASIIGFTRQLMRSSIGSLRELAGLSEGDDGRLTGVEIFGGISHLARVGQKFGFTVFDITNRTDRQMATSISKQVARRVSGDNRTWKELAENYKPAKTAFMSRQTLVDLFGSNGPENIRAAIRK